jgi:hypothetical protein
VAPGPTVNPPDEDLVTRATKEYVLVHGAAHGAWCWDEVRARLLAKSFYAMPLPRTYIRCLRDAAVSPAKAAEYAARLGVTPIDLDSAHDPMLSAPEELVRILDGI